MMMKVDKENVWRITENGKSLNLSTKIYVMGKVYRVNNLEEALQLANDFKINGEYDLFRGQALNWRVQSTGARLSNQQELDFADEKLKRLFSYFHGSTILKKYKDDIDWFFAVAQHYGLPTHYIDFSKSCEVAMFFATNSNSNKVGSDSTIICLNKNDFEKFNTYYESIHKERDILPPYIVEIDVDNLWRLQSQKGVFLFSPYTFIEDYYDFDKIIFPYEKPYSEISIDTIYPKLKSELEIYLDYYFDNEIRVIGNREFTKLAEELNIPINHLQEIDYSQFLISDTPHQSWLKESNNQWQFNLVENWEELGTEIKINIHIPLESEDYTFFKENHLSNLLLQFKTNSLERSNRLTFEIEYREENKQLEFYDKVKANCTLIWNGVRNLPYTDIQIATIITNYIFFEYYRLFNKKYFSINQDEILSIEMADETMISQTRCYVSQKSVENAFRNDLHKILKPEFKNNIQSRILLSVNRAQIIFDFEKMLNLFVEEIIPYQVLRNSQRNNPAIFYSPFEITIFGYA